MLAPSNQNDLRPTLSLLWLFAILNMVFRDIHEFTMASTLNEILSGTLNGNPMTETVLVYGAIVVELLLFAFILTALLPPIWSRRLNLVLVPIVVAGMFYIPPADPDDFFFASIELCTFAVVFVLTWRWKTVEKSNMPKGGRYAV